MVLPMVFSVKTLIPFLVVVAALLLLVGVLGVTMIVSARAAQRGSHWHRLLGVVTALSFPVAAVLTFGAWWFHRETRRR